jgi:hypothetical protein
VVDSARAFHPGVFIGKPLVIEKTFPLSCSIADMDDFLKRSKARTTGHVSFYWGSPRRRIRCRHGEEGNGSPHRRMAEIFPAARRFHETAVTSQGIKGGTKSEPIRLTDVHDRL